MLAVLEMPDAALDVPSQVGLATPRLPWVEHIFTSPDRDAPVVERAEARALKDGSLLGDWNADVTLITKKELEDANKRILAASMEGKCPRIEILPAFTRRHLIIGNMTPEELIDLKGFCFKIGQAWFFGEKVEPVSAALLPCAPSLARYFKTAGITARVLRSGTFRVKDDLRAE